MLAESASQPASGGRVTHCRAGARRRARWAGAARSGRSWRSRSSPQSWPASRPRCCESLLPLARCLARPSSGTAGTRQCRQRRPSLTRDASTAPSPAHRLRRRRPRPAAAPTRILAEAPVAPVFSLKGACPPCCDSACCLPCIPSPAAASPPSRHRLLAVCRFSPVIRLRPSLHGRLSSLSAARATTSTSTLDPRRCSLGPPPDHAPSNCCRRTRRPGLLDCILHRLPRSAPHRHPPAPTRPPHYLPQHTPHLVSPLDT